MCWPMAAGNWCSRSMSATWRRRRRDVWIGANRAENRGLGRSVADRLCRLSARAAPPSGQAARRPLFLALPLRRVAGRIRQILGRADTVGGRRRHAGRGNSADPAAAAALLGRQPRGVEEMLFQQPASQAERLQAALYFFQPLLGLAIALVWLWSGITSLFFYPHALSYRLLADAGVAGIAAPLALHGLAAMDIALGMATLSRYRIETLLMWQIGIVLAYSLFVAWRLPEFWLHPFGPLLKNIPFLFCLLIYRQMLGVKP